MKYAEIVVDVVTDATDKLFHYRIPPELRDEVFPGRRVFIPFGNRKIAGYVWRLTGKTEVKNVKDISSADDIRVALNPEFMEMIPWFCNRYYCRAIEAINLFLPPGYHRINEIREKYVNIIPEACEKSPDFWEKLGRRAPRQSEVLQLLRKHGTMSRKELLKKTGVSSAVVKELERKGFVVTEEKKPVTEVREKRKYNEETDQFILTAGQQSALDNIEEAINGGGKKEFLIHGVTGSGKTEVYLRSIKKCLNKGKGAILLVPEIALTPQMVAYFKDRLPGEVALLHSNLPVRERYNQWFKIKEGSCRMVLGTRSAVFAPVHNMGLIIVDEEQENSYKQEETPRYHAREVARRRAEYHDAVFVAGSATPSVETYWNAQNGNMQLVEIKNRATPFQLPEVEIVDMRKEMRSGNRSIFSRLMTEKLGEVLEKGEQALLFINRRGFSNFILCRECGFVVRCPHCSVSLTYHAEAKTMVCHYCSHISAPPEVCPECKGIYIRYFGAGTQRVEDEINNLFPGRKVLRMDRDSTSRKGTHKRLWEEFRAGKAQIMVGTQMVAKGLDFPGVTLVGVIAADTAIHLPDFRAAERTFQLITQVSGRAGRGEQKGEVVVQTYHPNHHSIVCVKQHDYHTFFGEEIERRRELLYPPFNEMLRFLFVSSSEKNGNDASQYMAGLLESFAESREEIEIMGPAPAPLFRIKKYFRYQLIIKGKNISQLHEPVRAVITEYKKKWKAQEVRLVVDFNPQVML